MRNISIKNIIETSTIVALSLITGLILSAAVIYIWWDFQIYSFSRLFRTALWLVPVITPAAFWSYRKLLPKLLVQSLKTTLFILLFALSLALLSATGLSTKLTRQHLLRLELPDHQSQTALQIVEIKLDGSVVLLDHVLRSNNWVEDNQHLVLNGDGAAWIEYPFQSSISKNIEVLVTSTGDPVSLSITLDGKAQTYQTAKNVTPKGDQLLLSQTTSLSLAYFSDFLPEILLLTAAAFILLSSLMFFRITENNTCSHLDLYWKVVSIISISGTSLFLYAATFTRPFADDYCYTNYVRRIGYGPAIIDFYNNWSGRFFSNLLLLGFSEQRFAPLVQILLWVAASALGFYGFFRSQSGARRFWLSLGSGFVVAFSTLALTPDILKSTYWIVSSVAVFPVLILLPLIGYILINSYDKQHKYFPNWVIGLGAFILTVASSTTHEVASPGILLLSATGLFIALITPVRQDRPRFFRLLIWITTAAVIGILIVILAPGNYNRQQNQAYPDFPGLWELIRMTWVFTVNFLAGIFMDPQKGLWLVAVAGFGFSSGKIALAKSQTNRLRLKRLMLCIIPILGFALTASAFVPGAYAMSAEIPARSQIIPTGYVVLTTLMWGYIAAQSIPRSTFHHFGVKLVVSGFTALLAITLFGSSIALLQRAYRVEQHISAYAAAWDARDVDIRSAVADGQLIQDITIPRIQSWDGPEQKYHCVRDYYRLKYP